jgi:hypothetical protein
VQFDYQISPDSSRVIYRAPQDTHGVDELYSVPIAGPAGGGVKLNGALVSGGDVLAFQISKDSCRVVYLADYYSDGVDEIFSVPLAGPVGDNIKLNGVLVTGGDVWTFQVSPDSSRVVYQADQQTNETLELYSVPLNGPASSGVKLNGTLVTGGDVWAFLISPNSSRVVYRANQDIKDVNELYSVPIAGPAGGGVKLNGALVTGGNVEYPFQISVDSSRVVYRADQQIDEVDEIYSVPLTGPAGAGEKLNNMLVTYGDVWAFLISPDSSRVVYRADQDINDVDELYSVPLAGPAINGLKLNGLMTVDGDVLDFQINMDSSRVVYRADQQTEGRFELYSTPLTGPAGDGVKINGGLVTYGDVWAFQINPDSKRVVYRADQETNDDDEIYSVSLDNPADEGLKLNGTLVAGGDVVDFQISPDSRKVVYIADQDNDDVFELYAAWDPSTWITNLYLPIVVK